ncbi:MAG: hypothetical protein FJ318_06990 [SAR202 cluster bacterium]|nr:hypothetical protein [SAR202 cluster bacterium]
MALEMTETAAMALKETVSASGLGEGELMRLVRTEDAQIALEPGRPDAGDKILRHEGEAILAVEPAVEAMLGDAIVDVGQGPQGAALVLRRPGGEPGVNGATP